MNDKYSKLKNLLEEVLLEYSEWLDLQGLIVADNATTDKRTHTELVQEFLNGD